jgi:hypothetical protein
MGILGTAASMAQVYSQNAVGFYTLNLVAGFNLVANQLNNGDNGINTIMPATAPVPDGSSLLTWNKTTQLFNPADTFFGGSGWFDENLNPSTTVVSPGAGAFIQLPIGSSASVVLVGDVPQGVNPTPLTLALSPGFQIVSQLTPQSLGLEATGFPAGDGDSLLPWDAAASPQKYKPALTYFGGTGWVDENLQIVDPTPAIGEAYFYQRGAANGSATWTREFSVNTP